MNNPLQQLDQSSIHQQRRGIALMLVMVAILVTGGMAIAYFGSRDNSIAISSNVEASTRARAVAESGLDLAIAILETDTNWRTNHVEGVLLSNFALGGGSITLTLLDSDTSYPPTETTMKVQISVLAEVEDLFQSAIANATVTPNDSNFDVDLSEFAIFAQSLIEIDDLASLQHWSASPISLLQQSLQMGTLATSPMSVLINSSSQLDELDLYTTSGASSMVTTSALNVLEMTDAPPFPSSPPAPLTGLELDVTETSSLDANAAKRRSPQTTPGNSSANYGFGSGQIDVQTGTYVLDDLTLISGETLAIHGDVTISILGDLVLHHTAILIDDDASLTLHIDGNVSVVTSYLGNSNQSTESYMDPGNLQLYGHNVSQWTFSGLTTLKGEIYAPESDLEVRGMTTICGRIAADEVTLRGASRLLYDPLLDNGGYADINSSLYDDNGDLYPELLQLTSLDPSLIDAIQQSLTVLDDGFENQYVNDWLSSPTARINDVIYVLLVYGVDPHRWEELASEAHWANDSDDDDRNHVYSVYARANEE